MTFDYTYIRQTGLIKGAVDNVLRLCYDLSASVARYHAVFRAFILFFRGGISMDFKAMFSRALRAARLDVTLFQEVENDITLNREALMVVVFATILAGIGSLIGGLISGLGAAVLIVVWTVIWGIAGYYVWSYLTWFIGTRLFQGTAEPGELLRTLGYASAPQALGIFGFIPCVGVFVGLLASIWSLVAGVIAVREALNVDTGKAIITVVIGWVVVFLIGLVVAGILGAGALGLGALSGSLQ
jgi:hypothetical protein